MDEQKYERVVWGGGLLLEDERVLMVRNQWPEVEMWTLPGGFSPPGEPLSETVRRELREEAGLEVLDLLRFYEGVDARRLAVVPFSDPHPNELAHRIAADAIAEYLIERRMVPADTGRD